MDKLIEPTNPVIGAAWGQTATVDLSIGRRCHTLFIEAIATAAATKTITLADVLGLLTLKVNGKPQRIHKATELDGIQTAYGAQYAANVYNFDGGVITYVNGLPQAAQAAKQTIVQFAIHLAEPWRKSYAATESLAWYTAWQDGSTLRSFSLSIEVPAKSANIDANSTITLNCYAETDNMVGPLDANKQPVALITRFERLEVPYSGAGDLYVTTLPKRHVLNQISMFSPTGDDITAVKVKKDNTIVRDVTRIRNDQTLIGREWNEAGLLQSRFDLGFDYSDLPTDGLILEGVKDFQVIPTMGAATATNKTVVFVSQVYGPLD